MLTPLTLTVTVSGNYNTTISTNPTTKYRDVPDIRFRFRLAGYPAIFGYPVPVPAKILAVAGYCSRIIYLFNRAKKCYFRK